MRKIKVEGIVVLMLLAGLSGLFVNKEVEGTKEKAVYHTEWLDGYEEVQMKYCVRSIVVMDRYDRAYQIIDETEGICFLDFLNLYAEISEKNTQTSDTGVKKEKEKRVSYDKVMMTKQLGREVVDAADMREWLAEQLGNKFQLEWVKEKESEDEIVYICRNRKQNERMLSQDDFRRSSASLEILRGRAEMVCERTTQRVKSMDIDFEYFPKAEHYNNEYYTLKNYYQFHLTFCEK